MLRVKNEERKIVLCLASILDVFAEIVLIDNGSTDSTVELVRAFAQQTDRRGKLTLCSYPFDVARCGEEHRSTPADSVHSLAYYYNWCLSKCRRSYVFKVDADMVVSTRRAATPEAVRPPLTAGSDDHRAIGADDVSQPGRPVVPLHRRDPPRAETLSQHVDDSVPQGEALRLGEEIPTARSVCEDVFYELKDTTEDEFLHWTDRASPRTASSKSGGISTW